MLKLFKNIGFGFFVVSSYTLLSGDTSLKNICIMVGSIVLMAICIFLDKNE